MVLEAVFIIRMVGRAAIVLSTICYYMYFQTFPFRASIDKEYQIRVGTQWQAKRDLATGRLNKAAFIDEMTLAQATPLEKGRAMLFTDIDYLKAVNGMPGHLCGDRLPRQIAEILRSSVETKGIPERFGREAF